MPTSSLKDTPGRYVYMDIWGVTAQTALSWIASFKKLYPHHMAQWEADEAYFQDQLRKQNSKD